MPYIEQTTEQQRFQDARETIESAALQHDASLGPVTEHDLDETIEYTKSVHGALTLRLAMRRMLNAKLHKPRILPIEMQGTLIRARQMRQS